MKILSWLREGTELKALVLTRSRKGNDVIRSLALDRLPHEARPVRLLAAWETLAQAGPADAELLLALVRVLSDSQTLSWQQLNLPEPRLRSVRRVQATAAHPRAYKGTHTRLPKAARTTLDLRPYLADRRWILHLLTALREHQPVVLARLADEGFSLPAGISVERLWRAWQLPDRPAELAPEFALSLLVCLQTASVVTRRQVLAHAASWPSSPLLVPALCRLLELSDAVALAALLDGLAAWPPARVLELLKIIAEIRPLSLEGLPDLLPVLVAYLALDGQDVELREYLCWALTQHVSADYLCAGLELAAESAPRAAFANRVRLLTAGAFPLARVRAVIAHCRSQALDWTVNHLALQIWVCWGRLPEFAGLFADQDWLALNPLTCTALLSLLTRDYSRCWGHEPRPAWDGYSGFVIRQAPDLIEALKDLAEASQPPWLELLEEYLCLHLIDKPYAAHRIGPAFQRAQRLFARQAQPGFEPERDCAWGLAAWIEALSEADFAVLMQRPDAELRLLEAEGEAFEEREFLYLGLSALLPQLPALGLAAVTLAPRRLIKLSQDLGMLKPDERRQVVAQLAQSPLMQDFSALPVAELVVQIRSLCQSLGPPGLTSPLPRKLRDWSHGQLTLKPGQLERARCKTLERLTLTRLDGLDALIWEDIFAEYPELPRTEPLRHALMVEKLTDSSRRALRRFIRRFLAGDREYLLRHPLNQHWLTQHPRCASSAWSQGLPYRCQWQGLNLTLSIESDPLEVLKMGTYVSSCLRLGGMFMFAAVAALLDINKQVVFARDDAGRVRARQLIAVDGQDRLVGFSVYPVGGPDSLNAVFLAHLEQLSAALDLKLYHSGHEAYYQIETLLAQDWWDDGAWDL